jgi:hypothetical protein
VNLKKGENMSGSGQKREPPKKHGGSTAKPLPPAKPAPTEDDDFEDGDFATPKRDRYGTDDEPL